MRANQATADPLATEDGPPQALLGEIAAGLASGESDLGPLLERFLVPIMQLVGAQAGAVRVLTADGDRLALVGSVGLPPELRLPGASAHRHCGLCGEAADTEAPAWTTDLRACAQRSGSRFFGGACRFLLAVPLRHRGRTLGIYNLFFASPCEPSPDVRQMLRAVGDLLGLALNNARLEQAQLRASLLQERQAMAAEVHDALAQSLAFVKMRMPLLEDAVRGGDRVQAEAYIGDIRGTLRQAHASVRGIITHLRAPMDPRGLLPALDASVSHFRRSSGTELDMVNELADLGLSPEQEAQVFHIVQEALANVARHAGAQHAWLQIGPARAGGLRIVVDDDGSGLPDPATASAAAGGTHYGLEIMAERARRLGGALDVGARPGGGTRVVLQVPSASPRPLARALPAGQEAR